MNNYKIKLNLTRFKNAGVTKVNYKSGPKECICIPIEDNNLYKKTDSKTNKVVVFANLMAWVNRGGADQYGNSHMVKMSVDRDAYAQMSAEERSSQPIFGNMSPIGSQGGSRKEVPQTIEDEDVPF